MNHNEGKFVLVADDDRNSLDLISTLLEYAGYQSIVANNGREAVELFEAHQDAVFLVLLDAMMPEMDGFEASAEIRRMAGETHIPILFITSLSKKDQVVKCLSVGDDIITKPFQHEILSAKVRVHTRISDLCRKVQEQNQQLSYYQKQTEMEHEVTEHIFNNFLSIGIAQNDNTRSYSSPLSRFNGDVLLVTPSANGSLYFFVGDVTGHGLPAAVSSVPASCAFQAMAEKGLSVGQIAREMNRFTCKVLPLNMMMAGIIGKLEPDGQTLQIWAGGMPDIIHLDENGKLLGCIESWHLPLGIEEDDKFQCDVKTLAMPLNSRFIMYTDGIIECRDQRDDMFGEERLLETCQRAKGSPFDDILTAVSEFGEDVDQSDDITLLELVFSPFVLSQVDESVPTAGGKGAQIPWTLTTTMGVDEIKNGGPAVFLSRLTQLDHRLYDQSGVLETVVMECFNHCLDQSLLNIPTTLDEQQADRLSYFNERKRRIDQLKHAEVAITLEISSEDGKDLVMVEIENRLEPRDGDRGAGLSGEMDPSRAATGDGLEQVRRVARDVQIKNDGQFIRAVIEHSRAAVFASESDVVSGVPVPVPS